MYSTPTRAIKTLLLAFLFFASISATASHVVGGEIRYECLGGNNYKVVLQLYRDCSGVVMPPSTTLTIRRGDGTLIGNYTVTKGPSSFLSVNKPGCGQPTPNICIETAKYTLASVNLPPSPFGYDFHNQGCCRNTAVDNIPNAWREGYTVHSQILGNAAACNNSAYFVKYPPVVLPANVPLNIDVHAADPDSDSLGYEICVPLDNNPAQAPFNNVALKPAYSPTNLTNSTPALSISPQGYINGVINNAGKYAVGICITEYKNGIPVGSIRRDYQFTVIQPWTVFATVPTFTNTSCPSANDGTATAAVGGGSGPYTFSWNHGPSTASVSNLAPGTYTVHVTDALGCKDSATVTIGSNAAFNASVVSQNNAGCGASAGGSATVAVIGGTAPITVTWPDASTGFSHSNLSPGTHGVWISDGGGCSDTLWITINASSSNMTLSGTTTDESCAGSGNGGVDLTVSNAVAPFSYKWSDGATTEDRNNLTAGNYWVAVTDSGGCTDTAFFTIGSLPSIVAAVDSIKTVTCPGGNDGYVSINTTNAKGPVSYLWSTAATSSSVSSLKAGIYWVVVSDSSGCSDSISVHLTAPDTLIISTIQVTNPLCFGSTAGSITTSVAGGTAPYSFSWSNGDTTQSITHLGAGTYTLTATDALGCVANQSYTISEPIQLVVSLQQIIHESCGNSNGSIRVSTLGGTAPYQYLWSSGSKDSLASNLSAGVHTLWLTDANGCTDTTSYTLQNSIGPAIVVDSVASASCGQNNGFAQVSASSGTPPYSFSWSNGKLGNSVYSLHSGQIVAYVTDSLGCIDSIQISIPNSAGVTMTLDSLSSPLCAGQANAYASVMIAGGTPPYSILWSNGDTLTSTSNLSAGPAYVLMTDAMGCSDSISFNVSPTLPLSVSLDSLKHNSCFGTNDGYLAINVAGGTAPYSTVWNTTDSTTILSNVTAGIYSVTITDANACSISATYTISSPDSLGLRLKSLSNPACLSSNGSISVGIVGGAKPYSILWSNSDTDSIINGLAAGTYSVIITDANGCTRTDSFNLAAPLGLSLSIDTVLPATCGGANGSASVSVAGGNGTVNVSWTGGLSGLSQTNLAAGNYTLTATDSLGCTDSIVVNIASIPGLSTTVDSVEAPSCFGLTDGYAAVTVIGGSLPYRFMWSNGDTTASTNALPSGAASVIIVDNNGCRDSVSITIPNRDSLLVTLDSLLNVSCNGSADGTIGISVSGGTAPYSYAWSNGDSTAIASNLPAGVYSVIVTDANSCQITLTYSISEPDSLSVVLKNQQDIFCHGDASGLVSIGIKGGTKPYSILWNNALTDSTIQNLFAGTYSAIITDANGCSDSISISLFEPTALVLKRDTMRSASCSLPNGMTQVSTTGGVPPYTYQWTNGKTTNKIDSVLSGTYTVIVSDSLGCSDSLSITIPGAGYLTATLDSLFTPSCIGDTNGFVSVSTVGGVPPYTVSWNTGDTGLFISNKPAGLYVFNITDNGGCVASASFRITQPDSIRIRLKSIQNTRCDSSAGSIAIGITGGTKPYSVSWSNGMTDSLVSRLAAGSYTVTVTDSNGCSQLATYSIQNPSGVTLQLDTISYSTCGQANAMATVKTLGGTAPYSILWSNGQSGTTANGLLAGTWGVQVLDANGCVDSLTITVKDTGGFSMQIDSLAGAACGGNNGFASLLLDSAIGPMSYLWSNGDTTATSSTLPSGLASVQVTDVFGCMDTILFVVPVVDTLKIALDSLEHLSCVNSLDGKIKINIGGGTPPYTISWTNGDTTSTLNKLGAGNFGVTVTDSRACFVSSSFTVLAPDTLSLLVKNQKDVSCAGDNDGSIALHINGGTPPYSFIWSNGQTDSTANFLFAGKYQVTITDSLGCSIVDSFLVQEPDTLSFVVDSILPAGCGLANGYAKLSGVGGTPPYRFEWHTGQFGNEQFGLSPMLYTVKITDTNDCEYSTHITIPNAAPLVLSLDSISAPSCFANQDGFAKVSAVGGFLPYSYLWPNGDTLNSSTTLSSGTHTLIVNDARGCSDSIQVTVPQTDSLVLNIDAIQMPSCNASGNGFVDVSVIGGTAPYQYTWSSGHSDTLANGLTAGQYQLLVTDANGCTVADSFLLAEPDSLIISLDTSSAASCGQATGMASIRVTGGTGNYSITWSNGETGVQADSLVAGAHLVTVVDSLRCSDSLVVNISSVQPLALVADSVVDPSCAGAADAYASVLVSGGIAPYSYSWANGISASYNDSLTSGTRWVLVTDAAGCVDSLSFQIQAKDSLNVTLDSLVDVLCHGASTGFLGVAVSGGTSPYLIDWGLGRTGNSIQNLAAGNYTATVTDSNGCQTVVSYTVSQPDSLIISLDSLSNPSCINSADGYIKIAVTGGVAPYSIVWSNSQTDSIATGLAAGLYSVQVSDANGCTLTDSFLLNNPDSLVITMDSVSTASCGNATGYASISITGGTGNYSVVWSNGEQGLLADSLSAGNHRVIVSDVRGCIDSLDFTIQSTLPIYISLDTMSSPSCPGVANGYAAVQVNGGVAPYTYRWNNSVSNPGNGTLHGGPAYVIVTDAAGCVDSLFMMIPTKDSIKITLDSLEHVLCYGEPSAYIEIDVTGGTKPYTINWNNSQQGKVMQNGVAGTYTVSVIDGMGCQASANFTITEPDTFYAIIDSIKHVSCAGASDGKVYISPSGNHVIGGIQTVLGKVSNGGVVNLGPGKYSVWVENGVGCTSLIEFEIFPANQIGITATTLKQPSCNSMDDGQITVSATGGHGAPYQYLWSDGDTTTSRSGLAPGTYTLTVIDRLGCQAEETYVLSSKNMDFDFYLEDPTCNSNEDAILELTVQNAVYPIEFWLDGKLVEHGQKLKAGKYTLKLIDAEGCTATKTVEVYPSEKEELFMANAFTPNNDGLNDVYELKSNPGCFENARLEIYTRWGSKVFETDRPFEEFWDGTIGGEIAKADIYMYNFSSDQVQKTGYLNIMK